MNKLAFVALLLLAVRANALMVTNGVYANTSAPSDPVLHKCWKWNAGQFTAIGWKVFVGAKHNGTTPVINYRGINYSITNWIIPKSGDTVFAISRQPLPDWAPVYKPTFHAPARNLQVMLIGTGWGCLPAPDGIDCEDYGTGNWYIGSVGVKRWGFAAGTIGGRGVRWKLGQAMGVTGDSGGSVFTTSGEFLCHMSTGIQGSGPVTPNSAGTGTLVNYFTPLIPPDLMIPPIKRPLRALGLPIIKP